MKEKNEIIDIILDDENECFRDVSKKRKTKRKVVIVLLSLFLLGGSSGLFLLYGPVDFFRDLLITTAMTTKEHQYLATIFYSQETIDKVLAKHVVIETGENTDVSLIAVEESEQVVEYESVYEEQILNRDKDAQYKVIPVKGNQYQGYLVAIYNPKNIKIGSSRYLGEAGRGEFITTIAKNNNALVAMNASGFYDPDWNGVGGIPHGMVISDGKIVYQGPTLSTGGGMIGFNDDGVLILSRDSAQVAIANGIKEAVEFGPFLIVNGKPSFIKGNGGWGIAPRTAIGQRQDGIVLFLVIDGRQVGWSIGADMVDMTEIMQRYKAYNAANLDGGSSSALVIEGNLHSRPVAANPSGERYIPNVFMLTE